MAEQLREQTRVYSWISGNRYLSLSEMENNATIIYQIMYSKGWSLNAICALLGNAQQESTINPGIWQNLTEGSGGGGGYGLVQWTPWTNFTNWADENGYEWDDGTAQCEWIDSVTAPFGQWIPTTDYPMSFKDFKTSTNSVQSLTSAFLKNFERAGVEAETIRQQNSEYWYEFLSGETPPTPEIPDVPDTPQPSTKRKKMPVWMMCKYNC